VQVIAYDWREALAAYPALPNAAVRPLADAAQVAAMLAHLEEALVAIDFLDPLAPKKLMPRLNQLFNRSGLTQEEIHILRGMAKAMLQTGRQTRVRCDCPSPVDSRHVFQNPLRRSMHPRP
jgi:tRNA/rRNA methyltransferase